MTSQLTRPGLLTVAEYLEIGEIDSGYTELDEGRLVTIPSPVAKHNRAVLKAAMQLAPQLPEHLEALPDIDVDLELVPPDQPGFCRRPDLIVVERAAGLRQEREGGVIRAADVVVVVEFVSPGSRRTDNIVKRGEYADAHIPHYWIVDLATPVSLLACHLAGEFGYVDGGAVTGTFSSADPFAVQLDLDRLL